MGFHFNAFIIIWHTYFDEKELFWVLKDVKSLVYFLFNFVLFKGLRHGMTTETEFQKMNYLGNSRDDLTKHKNTCFLKRKLLFIQAIFSFFSSNMERREFAIQILAFFFSVSKNVTEFICARKYLFPWDMDNGHAFFLQFLTIISYETKVKVRKWRNCITTLLLSWFQNFADFFASKKP